jgi:hypothetical protein
MIEISIIYKGFAIRRKYWTACKKVLCCPRLFENIYFGRMWQNESKQDTHEKLGAKKDSGVCHSGIRLGGLPRRY